MKENAYKPSDWLPTSVKEVRARGWDTLDVILFTGDAYVDHPSFGPAVVGRLLEAEGLRVAIVPQPNWRDDLRDFRKLGRPRLFFGVSAGTWTRWSTITRPTKGCAATTPTRAGGQGRIPARLCGHGLHAHPEAAVPRHAGRARRHRGLAAPRLAHYDYWSDSLKPSDPYRQRSRPAGLRHGRPGDARKSREPTRNGFNMHLLQASCLKSLSWPTDRYADSLGDEPLRLLPVSSDA